MEPTTQGDPLNAPKISNLRDVEKAVEGMPPGIIALSDTTMQLVSDLSDAINSLDQKLEPIMVREPEGGQSNGEMNDRDLNRPDFRLRLINSGLNDLVGRLNRISRQVNI